MMNKFIRGALGFLISGICLWFVFNGFDLASLIAALGQASFVWIIPAAIIFSFNFILRTLRWKIILSPLTEISVPSLFPIMMTGFFLNNVLPARAGELVRAYALSRKQQIPASSAIGTVVAERLSDFTGLFVVMALASTLIPWNDLPVIPVAVVVSILVVGCILFTLFTDHFRQLSESGSGFVQKTLKFLFQIPDGFRSLKSGRKISAVIGVSIFIWLNEVLQVWLISRMMNLHLGFIESACVIVGLSVGVMIPAAPGYIGTYELFGKEILVKLGYAAAPALNTILVLHFFQLISMAILGIPSMLKVSADKKVEA